MDKRSTYLKGVGIGLIIAGVTSCIAYLKMRQSTMVQSPVLFYLIVFEVVLSIAFVIMAYLIDTKKDI